MNTLILKTLQQAKRLIVIVVGSTVLLMGIAMIALPGPAFLVIPVGLGVLATEFVWARSLGKKIVEQTQKYISKRKGKEPYPRNQVRKKRNTLPDRELEKRKKMPEEVHRALAEEEKKRLREFLYVRRPKCGMELSEPIMLRKPIVAAVLALTLVL